MLKSGIYQGKRARVQIGRNMSTDRRTTEGAGSTMTAANRNASEMSYPSRGDAYTR